MPGANRRRKNAAIKRKSFERRGGPRKKYAMPIFRSIMMELVPDPVNHSSDKLCSLLAEFDQSKDNLDNNVVYNLFARKSLASLQKVEPFRDAFVSFCASKKVLLKPESIVVLYNSAFNLSFWNRSMHRLKEALSGGDAYDHLAQELAVSSYLLKEIAKGATVPSALSMSIHKSIVSQQVEGPQVVHWDAITWGKPKPVSDPQLLNEIDDWLVKNTR